MIFLDANNQKRKIGQEQFCVSSDNPKLWVPINVSDYFSQNNGIVISSDKASFTIKTDSFGTLPVTYNLKHNFFSHSLVDSQYSDILCSENIDLTAFWEAILFDYPLGVRTLNKNIIHVPGGGSLEIDVQSGVFNTARWQFFNYNTDAVSQVNEHVARIDDRLTEIAKKCWSNLSQDQSILLPLSGGLDSRLLAAHLAKQGDPKRIIAVTFAYSPDSYEYKIAESVCRILGINQHFFYKLDGYHYSKCIKDFWEKTSGNLSVLHSHLYAFIKTKNLSQHLLVTGFYSDPISGYAATSVNETDIKNSNVYKKIINEIARLKISLDIEDNILADLRVLHEDWLNNNDVIGFDEFLYLSQRQAKTFSNLIHIYRSCINVCAPFSDPCLIKLFLSLPYDLRKEKKIIRLLLSKANKGLSSVPDVSSSVDKSSLRSKFYAEKRRFSTRIQMISNILTCDKYTWISPYTTEDVFGSMRKESFSEIQKVCNKLRDLEIISEFQCEVFKKKAMSSKDAAMQARILSFLHFHQ